MLKRILAVVDRAIELLVVALFLAIVVVGSAQVFNRYVLNYSLSWSEEFQRYGQIWMVFLSIPIAYRRGIHIGLELLHPRMSATGLRIFAGVIDLLWMVLGGAIVAGLMQLMPALLYQHSAGLGLPMQWVYSGMLIGAFYMCLVSLRRLVANATGRLDAAPYPDVEHLAEE